MKFVSNVEIKLHPNRNVYFLGLGLFSYYLLMVCSYKLVIPFRSHDCVTLASSKNNSGMNLLVSPVSYLHIE